MSSAIDHFTPDYLTVEPHPLQQPGLNSLSASASPSMLPRQHAYGSGSGADPSTSGSGPGLRQSQLNPRQSAAADQASQMSDLTGRKVEPWEVAYFNGAAILDDIPVKTRDQVDQVAFRDGNGGFGGTAADGCSKRKVLDANRYATKKTIAQGMLDVALLTANASQLKYVLQVGEENHPFYHLMLILIIISIILQVIVGILFLVIGALNINDEPDQRKADILNDVIVVVIFIITLVNVILNGFGIRQSDAGVIANQQATIPGK